MATEPNPNVEQRVRAYAQERRRQADPPFQMPPATRRLLEGEIARQYGDPERPRRGWWRGWRLAWPYVGFGAPALAALALCVAIVWRERPQPASGAAVAARPASVMPAEREVVRRALPITPPASPAALPPPAAPATKAPATEAPMAAKGAAAYELSPAPAAVAVPEAAAPAAVVPTLAKSKPAVGDAVVARYGLSLAAPATAKDAHAARGETGERVKPAAEPTLAVAEVARAEVAAEVRLAREESKPQASRVAVGKTGELATGGSVAAGVAGRSSGDSSGGPAPGQPAGGRSDTDLMLAARPVLGQAFQDNRQDSGMKAVPPGTAPGKPPTPAAATPTTTAAVRLAPRPAEPAKAMIARAPAPVEPRGATQLTAPMPADQAAMAQAAANFQSLALSQRFIQLEPERPRRRNFNSPPRAEVLNDFYVRQTDGRLQITDADGSVYAGVIQVGLGGEQDQEARHAFAGRGTGRKALSGGLTERFGRYGFVQSNLAETNVQGFLQTGNWQTGELAFDVEGTNRTTGQKVVFKGRWLLNNAAPPAVAAGNVRQQAEPAKPALETLNYLNNSMIRGRVVLGERVQMDVNAVPANQQNR